MQASMHSNSTEHLAKFASDGFMLNLLDLLLEYSMPFCSTPYCNKLLKINFTYALSSHATIEGLELLFWYRTEIIANVSLLTESDSFSVFIFNFELDGTLLQAPAVIPQLIMSLCAVSMITYNKLSEIMTPFHGGNKVRPRINVTTGNKTFNWLFDTYLRPLNIRKHTPPYLECLWESKT